MPASAPSHAVLCHVANSPRDSDRASRILCPSHPRSSEKFANIAFRHLLAVRDRAGRKIAVREMRLDVGLDGAQPSGPNAAALGNGGRIARCAECHCYQVAAVGNHEPPHVWKGEGGIAEHRVHITF